MRTTSSALSNTVLSTVSSNQGSALQTLEPKPKSSDKTNWINQSQNLKVFTLLYRSSSLLPADKETAVSSLGACSRGTSRRPQQPPGLERFNVADRSRCRCRGAWAHTRGDASALHLRQPLSESTRTTYLALLHPKDPRRSTQNPFQL